MRAAQAARAVDLQQQDPDSCLNWTRRLLRLRHAHAALRTGRFEVLQADDRLLAVLRQGDDDAVLCAFNLSAEAATLALPRAFPGSESALTLGRVQRCGQVLHLGPWAALLSPVCNDNPAGA